jgi:hypothetical protein
VRVITELIATIQDGLDNSRNNWEFDFDGRRIVNAYRKGKNKLVLELGDDAEITIRFKANGKKTTCPVCRKAKVGWPHWWRNIARRSGAVCYACHDCVVDSGGDQSDSEAGGPEAGTRH